MTSRLNFLVTIIKYLIIFGDSVLRNVNTVSKFTVFTSLSTSSKCHKIVVKWAKFIELYLITIRKLELWFSRFNCTERIERALTKIDRKYSFAKHLHMIAAQLQHYFCSKSLSFFEGLITAIKPSETSIFLEHCQLNAKRNLPDSEHNIRFHDSSPPKLSMAQKSRMLHAGKKNPLMNLDHVSSTSLHYYTFAEHSCIILFYAVE